MSQTKVLYNLVTDGTNSKSKIVHHRWKLTSNFSTGTGVEAFTAGWSSVYAIGTAMSESSGVFTFPFAGQYKISFGVHGASSPASTYRGGGIQVTTDNSSYSATGTLFFTSNAANTYWNARQMWILDIADTSTHKVRFNVESQNNTDFKADSSAGRMMATFIRVGDTP